MQNNYPRAASPPTRQDFPQSPPRRHTVGPSSPPRHPPPAAATAAAFPSYAEGDSPRSKWVIPGQGVDIHQPSRVYISQGANQQRIPLERPHLAPPSPPYNALPDTPFRDRYYSAPLDPSPRGSPRIDFPVNAKQGQSPSAAGSSGHRTGYPAISPRGASSPKGALPPPAGAFPRNTKTADPAANYSPSHPATPAPVARAATAPVPKPAPASKPAPAPVRAPEEPTTVMSFSGADSDVEMESPLTMTPPNELNFDDPSLQVAREVRTMLDEKWAQTPAGGEKFDWTASEKLRLKGLAQALCSSCVELFRTEAYPVQHITSPIFVLGDIHGRYEDLHFFLSQFYTESTATPPPAQPVQVKELRIANNLVVLGDDGDYEVAAVDKVPGVLSSSTDDLLGLARRNSNYAFGKDSMRTHRLLFLGDFVDRGQASLEVVMYVLALKVLSPKHVFLIRGNHELEIINGNYGFLAQCQELFGPHEGQLVWAYFNKAFNGLPLAAILDQKVFCVHGGIPRPAPDGTEDRMQILRRDWTEIRDSATQWELIQEDQNERLKAVFDDILWADPAPEGCDLDEQGFGPSTRGISVSYSVAAVDKFLAASGMSLIMRAHEVKARGFNVCQSGKVITIFTSSHYGGPNVAGAAYIANGTIRAITRKEF